LKANANSFCSLSGVTPKLVSVLTPNLLLWGTPEPSLLGPFQHAICVIAFWLLIGCFFRARSSRLCLATAPSRCTGSAHQMKLNWHYLYSIQFALYIADPQHPPPAPQAEAPGQDAPLEHAGPLDILPIAIPPTRDMSFWVSLDLHLGQGRVLLVYADTISSNTIPHFVHSYS
jgi:hypothetical protein